MQPPPRLQLGPWRPLSLLGRGGMAEVWSAYRAPAVALKLLTPDAAREPRLVRAVRTEVRIAARLHHPGIIRVLDTGEVHREGLVEARARLDEQPPPPGVDGHVLAARLAVAADAHDLGAVQALISGELPELGDDVAPLLQRAADDLSATPDLASRVRRMAPTSDDP